MAFPSPSPLLTARDLTAAELKPDPVGALLRIYTWMHYARTLDNRYLDFFRQGIMKGTVCGGQGNEGLVVPLALLADKANDVVSFTHRGPGGTWSGASISATTSINTLPTPAAPPVPGRVTSITGIPRTARSR